MKPILFNTEMVRAILDGRKSVTRRVVKRNAVEAVLSSPARTENPNVPDAAFIFRLCNAPYEAGDILYVRETWRPWAGGFSYKADAPDWACQWRPSIHMPREAARIFLRVTDVRVERLQQSTVEDILSEGTDVEIPPICKQSMDPNFPTNEQRKKWKKMTEVQREEYANNRARATYIGWCDYADRLFRAFKDTWDSTIKPADLPVYGWKANPWVWVIGFERMSREEALGKHGQA